VGEPALDLEIPSLYRQVVTSSFGDNLSDPEGEYVLERNTFIFPENKHKIVKALSYLIAASDYKKFILRCLEGLP
jgi:hypothetical protein